MGAPWSGEIGKVRRVPEGGSRTTEVVVIDALPIGELLSGWQRHLNRFLDGGRSFCETACQHHREGNQDNQRAPHDRIEGSPATPVEETCSSACTARGGSKGNNHNRPEQSIRQSQRNQVAKRKQEGLRSSGSASQMLNLNGCRGHSRPQTLTVAIVRTGQRTAGRRLQRWLHRSLAT